MKISFIILIAFNIFAQTAHYVSTDGLDSSNCGDSDNHCSSINQIFTNYPGVSFTILISEGTYSTKAITLQRNAYIIFQGDGSPTIAASWSGIFITNTPTSGVEFHDLSLTLSGGGTGFTQVNTVNNSVGFFNVVVSYLDYTQDFVDVNGGTLTISNVTLENTKFDGFFISAKTNDKTGATSVVVANSTFNNIIIGTNGGILVYDVYGGADSTLNTTTFENVTSASALVAFWARNSSQTISITFSQFFDVSTSGLPSVYVVNTFQSTTYVRNTTWVNATSDYTSGALEIDGPNDGQEHGILTLQTLNFAHCSGKSVGGMYIAYASIAVNNAVFLQNAGDVANDVIFEVDSSSSVPPSYEYYFTTTCSTSSQTRAVLSYAGDGTQADISDQIPTCRCLSNRFSECREGILDDFLVDA